MLRALLFDLDGTLVDSDPTHFTAWQRCLAPHGVEIDQEGYRRRISGRLNPDIVADLLPGLQAEEAARLVADKERLFRELAGALEPLAGLPRLLAWASRRRLATGLVTNAPGENARFLLAALGLERRFDVVVLAEEAPAGKPDPAPYRLALQRLDLEPESVLAFEDSPSGVAAAAAAGIEVAAVLTSHSGEALEEAGATLALADFDDPLLWRRLDAAAVRR